MLRVGAFLSVGLLWAAAGLASVLLGQFLAAQGVPSSFANYLFVAITLLCAVVLLYLNYRILAFRLPRLLSAPLRVKVLAAVPFVRFAFFREIFEGTDSST